VIYLQIQFSNAEMYFARFRALGTILADHPVIARPRAKARKLVAR
jgi:hypothetical protein